MKNFNADLAALASSFTESELSFIPPSRQIAADPASVEAYFKETLLEIAQKSSDAYDESARLKEDLGLDSLDLVELIMYCEKDLGITLRDHEWQTQKTVAELLDLLFSKCLVPV